MKKLLFLLLPLLLSQCNTMQKADYIVKANKIYTVDSAFSTGSYMAVRDGKILEVGDSFLLAKYSFDTLIDYGDKFIYPGFYDAHAHFYYYGLELRNADLTGTKSIDEIISRLKKHRKNFPAETWLVGRGWDQNDWEDKSFPTNEVLDKNFPDIPVVLTRIDGHAVWANTKALEIAGITADTKIDGGEVLLQNGKPTGVLIDKAAEYMQSFIPQPGREQQINALLKAQENCFAVGMTSVADAGLPLDVLLLIDSLQKAGKLKMRIYAMCSADRKTLDYFWKNGKYKTDRLNIRSVKLYSDGALGSRGALLLQPYSDDPGNYGLLVTPIDTLKEYIREAYEHGFQVNTHAIGDSANRLMLDLYAEVLKGKNDLRWRIEHAQVINSNDFHKFADYSIIPSVQPTHATSDMYWAEQRLGPQRIKGAYAYKTLLEQNGWLALGSDFPIEDINPLLGIYAAVTRRDLSGYPKDGFMIEQALTREEALRGFTVWAARAAFEEKEKGSLEPGKFADFVVLDRDIMTVDASQIPQAKVVATYLGGESVYKKTQ